MPLDLVQRRIILDRCNQSDEEVKSTCQKVFPETQGARRAIAQATPDCEKSISEFMLGKFAHVARFCRNMVNNGQTLESMLLPQLARQDILKDCNNSEEELKATCQKIITDPNSAKPSEACNDEMESLLGFEPSLAREGQYLAPDFCADVLRGMSFNEITSKKGIIQPTINEILGACQESEDILKSTCRKYQPEPPAPKPPAALEASEKCETEINDQFKPLPGVAGEHDQFNFCRDIVGGKSLENFGKERYLSSSTLTSIRDACEPSEEVIKLTCEKLLHFEASEKCNTEINEQFKRVPGISREDDYIPSDFCREIMGGKSLENIGKEKYFNPLTLASIRDACEPSEEVIKLTCEKLPRFEPEPDSNPDSPTPSDTKFELNQSASSNNQPGANADPVIPTLPSTCQLDSKPCEWSECRPFDNGSSRYDPKTGKEVVYKEKNAEGVPEGECKGRFGPACADGLSRQLVCGKRSTPDCQRNKRECYWVGQGPICPTFFLGDGQKDVHGRSFITGLDKKGGYTRMNPLADCREKAGARCEEGWKQLWCA
ncbi:hypothetical protein CDD81_995 [Ophiocordyceps australis]|uniref:Uncharacterized protein n=1 Tax=Ophiocordyceps australis TaxID=1399860 RepID=A0A2C5Y0R3_9HYPO|nr:hypothetical protein CDD81_995 [Ophiocordyceps australis]